MITTPNRLLPRPKEATYATVLHIVAEEHALTEDEVATPTRKHRYSKPRQIDMMLANTLLRMKLKAVGVPFGIRNHTTAIHAIKSVRGLYQTDKTYRLTMDRILSRLASYPSHAYTIPMLKKGLAGDDRAMEEVRFD